MALSIKDFKNRASENVKEALKSFQNALDTANERLVTENVELDPKTADAVRKLTTSVRWLNTYMNKKPSRMEPDEYERLYKKNLLALETAGHILNDPAGAGRVRDYLVPRGMKPSELDNTLKTIELGLNIDMNKDTASYTDPNYHKYYASMLSGGKDYDDLVGLYSGMGILCKEAQKNIKFRNFEEEKDFTEMVMAFGCLSLNRSLRKNLIEEVDGKKRRVVLTCTPEQAIKKLNYKKVNEFLYAKYGDNKTTYQRLREEMKDFDNDAVSSLSNDLRRETDMMKAVHTKDFDDNLDIVKSGTEWIDQIKESERIIELEDGNDVSNSRINRRMLAKILAVRALADAKPGSKSKLDSAQISSSALEAKTNEILEDENFLNRALASTSTLDMVEMVSGSGHCGNVEKKIKTYFRNNIKPGYLPNSPAYAHYLPTVKERIEMLQDKYDKWNDDMKVQAAAEIVALRNIVHAHRGKKSSLDKPIPVSELNNLESTTHMIASDPKFREMVLNTRIGNLLCDGHGGDMVDKMREYIDRKNASPDQKEHFKPITSTLIKSNTLGGRMAQLRYEAETVQKQMQNMLDQEPGERNEALLNKFKEKSEKILMEYHMCNQESHKIEKGKEKGLDANIPWIDFDKSMQRRDTDPRYRNITMLSQPETLNNILKHLVKESPAEFFSGNLADKGNIDIHIEDNIDDIENIIDDEDKRESLLNDNSNINDQEDEKSEAGDEKGEDKNSEAGDENEEEHNESFDMDAEEEKDPVIGMN
ncbi:MAG: hypothetical protein IKN24_05840 [Lachnospiraceae bacterium]|nr:hypothetical protein [Lachnospiraceae bacterium]